MTGNPYDVANAVEFRSTGLSGYDTWLMRKYGVTDDDIRKADSEVRKVNLIKMELTNYSEMQCRRDAMIFEAYAAGISVARISNRSGITRSTIYRVLKRKGVTFGGPAT